MEVSVLFTICENIPNAAMNNHDFQEGYAKCLRSSEDGTMRNDSYRYTPIVHHYDPVAVDDRVQTMSNRDHRAVGEFDRTIYTSLREIYYRESILAVASSNTRILLFLSTALAKQINCFCPVLRLSPPCVTFRSNGRSFSST